MESGTSFEVVVGLKGHESFPKRYNIRFQRQCRKLRDEREKRGKRGIE